MNKQEIFDKVAVHLMTQKNRALDYMGSCMYRDEHGNKCAIGCLIPDDLYPLVKEGESVIYLSNEIWKALNIHINNDMIVFLQKLQSVHDNAPRLGDCSHIALDEWKDRLINVAKQYNLNYDVVENFKS